MHLNRRLRLRLCVWVVCILSNRLTPCFECVVVLLGRQLRPSSRSQVFSESEAEVAASRVLALHPHPLAHRLRDHPLR